MYVGAHMLGPSVQLDEKNTRRVLLKETPRPDGKNTTWQSRDSVHPPHRMPVDVDEVFAAARRGDAQFVLGAVVGADELLRAREANGWTLLHIFSRLSLPAPVRALLEMGADAEARDSTFRSALHMAASADAHPDAGGVQSYAEDDRPKAMLATLRFLLKGGARVTARDSFGMTALHHAARAGRTEAVRFLLNLNMEMRMPRAPLEADTNAEERPLHLAAAGGHLDTVCMLLKNGAHPGKTNYLGQSALHLAVSGGDTPAALAVAREFVKPEWKVDLSSAARDGSTPLHMAAAGGHDKMVRVLLHARKVLRTGGGRGVQLEAKDGQGRMAVDVAREEGFADVVAMLDAEAKAAADRSAKAPAQEERELQRAFAESRLDSISEGTIPSREGRGDDIMEQADDADGDDD